MMMKSIKNETDNLYRLLAWLERLVGVWSHQDPSVSPHRATG